MAIIVAIGSITIAKAHTEWHTVSACIVRRHSDVQSNKTVCGSRNIFIYNKFQLFLHTYCVYVYLIVRKTYTQSVCETILIPNTHENLYCTYSKKMI